jgi:pimeloyl-ACP methyl ester carboxylesterase
MRASAYLGDLGGLSAYRRLILLDQRGTGQSAIPADTSSYRCDRLVDDVAALQDHLGLERVDLVGHSAGANIAVQYAAGRPERVSRLALITPSGRAVGLEPDAAVRRQMVGLRHREPWFAEAAAAFERVAAGSASEAAAAFERVAAGSDSEADWQAMVPFFYGRWDSAAQAHCAAGEAQTNEDAAQVFASGSAFDPGATRAALAAFGSPVLVLAGGLDPQRPLTGCRTRRSVPCSSACRPA